MNLTKSKFESANCKLLKDAYTIGLDNLGFGKFKLFRLDYIRSYQNGYIGDGVIFGLKILNAID
jgi:hypothetical protein